MVTLLIMLVILGLIFWALCELISAFAGMIFLIIAAGLIIKMAKEIFK